MRSSAQDASTKREERQGDTMGYHGNRLEEQTKGDVKILRRQQDVKDTHVKCGPRIMVRVSARQDVLAWT